MKIKKAYKIFNNDWTCNGFQYEIGKEYKYNGDITLCARGFHACLKLQDCFNYYSCVSWNKFAEVEILGDYKKNNNDSKIVTNHIKIVKEIFIDDFKDIITRGGNNIRGGNDIWGWKLY